MFDFSIHNHTMCNHDGLMRILFADKHGNIILDGRKVLSKDGQPQYCETSVISDHREQY